MTYSFPNLLVSSPNGGGLFAIQDGRVVQLDDLDSTGLWASGRRLLRGLQPDTLRIYGPGPLQLEKLDLLIDDIHDVIEHDSSLYVVGTTKNVVVRLDLQGNLCERWQLPGEDDSSHVNCIALWNGRLVLSCFGEFREHRGYKGTTAESGCIRALTSGEIVVHGLSQPHSLTPCGETLLVANSEKHELREYSPDGSLLRSTDLGGYTRGICVHEGVIFVGLSSRRDVEAAARESSIVALDETSWKELGRIALPAPEIYAIAPLSPVITGALLEVASETRKHLTEHRVELSALRDEKHGLEDDKRLLQDSLALAQARCHSLETDLASTRRELASARRSLVERVWSLLRRFRHESVSTGET